MTTQISIAALPLLLLCLALTATPSAAVNISNLYSNGPYSSTNSNAWEISNGYSVSNSFWLPPNANVTWFTFAVWLTTGATLSSVDVQIGSTPFGGTTQTPQVSNPPPNFLGSNSGYSDITATTSFPWSGGGWLGLGGLVRKRLRRLG
jgi:hypothetical protein